MAFQYETAPNNFASGTEKSVTRYLDLAGLSAFWGKVKKYVDDADYNVFTTLNKQSDDYNAAIRAYIESLQINGVTVTSTKTDGVGTSLSVTIDGDDILVGGATTGGNTESNYVTSKVSDAIHDLDKRSDAIEAKLAEGVVSGLIVDAEHAAVDDGAVYGEGKNSTWVSITEVGTPGATADDDAYATGDIKIVVNDTAINTKFSEIDQDIADLEANAGVTNIAVVDNFMDHDGVTAGDQNLVSIVLQGTKATKFGVKPEGMSDDDWNAYKAKFGAQGRGDILISLDESVLDERLDGIDATVAAEIADRKEDVANLAGSGYTAADGATAGAWKKTGENFDVKYRNITDLSARLADIDANLVTKIEEGTSTENYVTLTVDSTPKEGSNDNAVTITVNDGALKQYTGDLATNLVKLNETKVNGHTLITAVKPSDSDVVTITKTDVTLTTEDIRRSSADGNGAVLEDVLEGYDAKMTALASATHFRGAYGSMDAAKAAIKDQGDVVIIGNKEYVYYDPAVTDDDYQANGDFKPTYVVDADCFVELGDTEAETQRIGAIETWINTNIISVADMENSTYFEWTVPTYDAPANTPAKA